MKFFKKADLNAFWALFADNLANMVILTGILKFVFKMPNWIIFGRVLPALGLALATGLSFYAYLGYRLSKKENRNTVTSLPYGISTPVMFVYLFGIIGPVYWRTDNPILAWQIGIAAAFIGGIIEAFGSIFGPILKKYTPRAGMLGTLAGIAIVWIATVPLSIVFESPFIGFVSLIILFAGLVAGVKFPLKIPAGLVAITIGTIIAFIMGTAKFSIEGAGFYPPIPVFGDLIHGFKMLLKNTSLFAIILPIEIYNFIETMNNVESAEAAGDKYNVAHCQIADGIGTMIGSIFGSPLPTTVYIGHPAYKRLGAGIGYAWLVGAIFFVGNIFGLVAFLHHLIPEAAVAPILVFIGLVITAQAYRATKARYAIAVSIAIIPHISDFLITKFNTGTKETIKYISDKITAEPALLFKEITSMLSHGNLSPELITNFTTSGFHFAGQQLLSQGSILIGLLWGSVIAFLIDFKFLRSAIFSFIAALLTMFGFIHSPTLKLQFSNIFWGYIIMGITFIIFYFIGVKKDPDIEGFEYSEK